MKIYYPAIMDPAEEGGYLVSFPDFDDAITEGDTIDEAMANAEEVLDLVLAHRLENGLPIPEPGRLANCKKIGGKIIKMISPSVTAQAALLVRFARGQQPLADLARAINTSWPAVARLENPKHWPTLRQLEKAAAALGKHLVLSFE